MSAIRLDTPFLDGGLRSTSWFNGRIVSREDMQRDRDAERAIDERLGRALGPGIVSGFEVETKGIGGSSVTDPVVTVRAGLALNRLGQTVALARDVDVALKKPTTPPPAGSPLAGSFDTCAPPSDVVYVVGTGVYLLAAAPAQAKQGLALVSGLGNEAAPCNAKEVVAGLQFRLFQMKLTNTELADDAHLRNVAAYKVFLAGGGAADLARDLLGVAATVPALTDPQLTDCDVPLALFQWTATGGVRWVDRWSVRRRLAPPMLDGRWPLFDSARQAAAGTAMVLQFQEHLTDLRASVPGGNFKATDFFRWLPPLGVIPVQDGGHTGHDIAVFFSGIKRRDPPAFIEGAKLPALFAEATLYPPIDPATKELVWTYFVHENIRARDQAAPAPGPQPYLVFTNGQMPYRGDARYDLSYVSYANYAIDGGP